MFSADMFFKMMKRAAINDEPKKGEKDGTIRSKPVARNAFFIGIKKEWYRHDIFFSSTHVQTECVKL